MKNTTIILFGASGDLAKRKIFPALYHFTVHEKLENIIIIGAAFDDVSIEVIVEKARPFIKNIDEKVWSALQKRIFYKKIDFNEVNDFKKLQTFVEKTEKDCGFKENNRLFFLATAPQFFCPITNSICSIGLAQRYDINDNIWHRVVYEKPFGRDKVTAHEINTCIKKFLNESQVYRIDHYLSKEIVSNIAMIRFTNCVFEPLWSHRYIDHVQIIASETIGLEGRGAYYDQFGALRDVVQNHMLELLALVCMESPEKLTGDFVRGERAKVLEKVQFVEGTLGQYEGYLQEESVQPHSTTETFASLKFFVNNARWSGVPFYIKTGKCLDKKETTIHIKFKQVDCLLLRGCPMDSNWLTIKIAPDQAFVLTLNAKDPNSVDNIVPVQMEFCHSCIFGLQTPQAYEIIFEEVMRGEQSISVRYDEIEYAWQIIDQIFAQKLRVYHYKKATIGPQEDVLMQQRWGIKWRS